MGIDTSFSSAKGIEIRKEGGKYSIKVGGRQEMELPLATNFEWRVGEGAPPVFTHMYFGNETGNPEDFNFHITFEEPCDVRIQNPDARCYVYVGRKGE